MTEQTENTLLRDALLDAAAEEFAAELNDTTGVDASPRLRRQMTAMLSDPDTWAKRKRRPAWQKVAHTAAMILLTCTLSFAVLMTVSPDLRAGMLNWGIEASESGVFYRFSGADPADSCMLLPRYEIADFPEGYELYVDEYEFIGGYNAYYISVDDPDGYICFDYMLMVQGGGLGLDGDDYYEVSDVEVNGLPGKLYQFDGKENDWEIVWIDEEQNLIFNIGASLGSDELLRMAESVRLVEQPLVLPHYAVTAFPEGYTFEKTTEYTLLQEKETVYDLCPAHKNSGGLVLFYYASLKDTKPLSGNNELRTPKEVTVNGCPGRYYAIGPKNSDALLVWTDEEAGMWFSLEGEFTEKELLHMAESVSLCDVTNLEESSK